MFYNLATPKDLTAAKPIVAVETSRFESIANYNGSYTLLMADPDPRYPRDPTSRFILHWLQTDLTTHSAVCGRHQSAHQCNRATNTLLPTVLPTNSAHQYLLYAFFQHDNFTFTSDFEGFNAQNRSNFNLTLFLDDTGRSPVVAMYFFVSNETAVTPDFTAAAGARYPGGNGEMITTGPGPSITPSTSPTIATASTTGMNSGSGSGSERAAATGSAASSSATSGVGRQESDSDVSWWLSL